MSTRKITSYIFSVLCASTLSFSAANAQPFAYVSNLSGNVITVVNTSNGTVSATIRVPPGPTGLAVTPDGSSVYVASQSANSVSVINTGSNSVVNTIGVGPTPVSLAITPNGGQVYVVDQGSNQVSVIDTASQSVVNTIGVGQRPVGVAISPDGSRAFVTNLFSGNVSVIDTGSRSVINTFSALSGPSGITVAPNGRFVYVGNQYSGVVTVHDVYSGNIVATIGGFVFPNSLAITPNGARVFVTNGNGGSVGVIDTGSNSMIGTMGTGSLPTSVAISPDGTRAFVTNEFSFTVSVIDTNSNAVVNTIPRIGVYPIAVALQPASGGVPPPPPPNVCSYSLSSGGTSLGSGGGSGNVTVSAGSTCDWQASSDSPWLNINYGYSGTGNGTVGFSAGPNGGSTPRNGTLTIGGQRFTVSQSGVAFSAIRVNCGGPAITDAQGNPWSADNAPNHTETNSWINNTNTPAIYQKESWSTGTLQYQFNVPNGSVTVKLRFAEFYLTQRGQRVFNILINGVNVSGGFDILAQTGPNTAYDVSFPTSVNNGQITIQLVPIIGSPKLSGIEIF